MHGDRNFPKPTEQSVPVTVCALVGIVRYGSLNVFHTMIYALLNSQFSMFLLFIISNATFLTFAKGFFKELLDQKQVLCCRSGKKHTPLEGSANQKGLAVEQTSFIRKTKKT